MIYKIIIATFVLLLMLAPAVVSANAPLPQLAAGMVYTVQANDWLSKLADKYYNDEMAWPAIMLATNGRLADNLGLNFIGDPNQLEVGQKLWVPDSQEAALLRVQYEAYLEAVQDAAVPQPWEISKDLLAIPPDQPIMVVTWARSGQFETAEQPRVAGKDIWVSVVPEMKAFCQGLGLDLNALTFRLEQRLRLPPKSNKTEFVEILVENPAKDIFRPCPDPHIDTHTCPIGPPPDTVSDTQKAWLFSQYYQSYALAQPLPFPWTALGYTYDWGNSETEVGASEFVISKEATIIIKSITETAAYCSVE